MICMILTEKNNGNKDADLIVIMQICLGVLNMWATKKWTHFCLDLFWATL